MPDEKTSSSDALSRAREIFLRLAEINPVFDDSGDALLAIIREGATPGFEAAIAGGPNRWNRIGKAAFKGAGVGALFDFLQSLSPKNQFENFGRLIATVELGNRKLEELGEKRRNLVGELSRADPKGFKSPQLKKELDDIDKEIEKAIADFAGARVAVEDNLTSIEQRISNAELGPPETCEELRRNFEDIEDVGPEISGVTGDAALLGSTLNDVLLSGEVTAGGLQETLGQVLPTLGEATMDFGDLAEDSMARAREAVEDLADGLGTVLDEALRGQIESFEDFGRRVLEILREIGFGLLEEEGLDPKSLIRKAIGSIFGDDEGETPPLPRRRPEGMEGLGALAATDVANNPDIFGGLPAVSEQVAVSLQNAGAAAGLLEGSGLGASEVLGSSLAAEALNAAFAATTETAASQTLVGVLAQLTAAAQSAAVALQSVAASAGAGGGGGGGGLGFLSSFFNPTSSAARPGGGFGAPGAVNPGPGFPVRLQHGGFAEAFRPAIVGESGPEMIVPHVPSTVIPNNALGGVTLNVSINAPGADRAGTDAIREEVRQLRGVVAALNSGIEPRALAAVSGKANRGGGFARTVGRRG